MRFRDVALTSALLIVLAVMPSLYRLTGQIGVALILVIMTAGWVRFHLSSGRGRLGTTLPALLMLAGIAIPIIMAVSPRFALESALIPLVAVGVLIFLGSGLFSRDSVLVGIAIAGGVAGLLTLIDFGLKTVAWVEVMAAAVPDAGLTDLVPVTPPRATANPYLHPNATAPMLYIALIASLAVSRLNGFKGLAWMTGLLAGLGLISTGSRSGVLGALFGLGITWILLSDGSAAQRTRRIRVVLIGLTGSLVGLVGLWMAGVRPDFIFRSTFIDRLPVMELGLEMAADSPWVGHGSGAFPYLYPLYGPDLYPGVEARLGWIHSHNAYVEALLEFGLVGSTLIASGIVVLVVAAFRSGRNHAGSNRLAVAVALGAVAAMAMHSTSDIPYIHVGPVCFGAATLAAAVPTRQSRSRLPLWTGWAMGMAAMLVVPVVIALTVGAHLEYLAGRQAVGQEDAVRALKRFNWSVAGDDLPVYRQALNFAESEVGGPLSQAPDEDLAPFLTGSFPLNLSKVAIEAGDLSEAADHLAIAYPLIQGDEVALVEFGFISLDLGQEDDAVAAFAEAVRINAWLSNSPFLDTLSDEMRAIVLDTAFQDGMCWFGDEWILTGAATEAHMAMVKTQCPQDEPPYLMVMVRTGKAKEALAVANTGLETASEAVDLRRVAGLAALEIGEIDESRRHLALAALLGDPYSAHVLRSTFVEEIPSAIEELNAGLSHGHSPVLLDLASSPVYLYGGTMLSAAGDREALPSPLAQGPWQQAYSVLHLEMIGTSRPRGS